MMSLSHGLEAALITTALMLLLWSGMSVLVALAYTRLRQPLTRVHTPTRRRILLMIGAAPLIVAACTTLMVLTPGLPLTSAHCHASLGCDAHSPMQLAAGDDDWMIGSLVTLTLGLLLWRITALMLDHRRYGTLLRALPRQWDPRGFWIVRTAQPLALTAGLRRGTIHLSDSLLQALDEDTLNIVLDHERAHDRHHDNLTQLLLSLLFCPLSARPARALLADLRDCAEYLADQAAAVSAGAERVARALLALHRLALHTPSPSYASFGASTLERRIAALIDPPQATALAQHDTAGILIAGLAISAATVNLVHHLLEHLLIWLR